MKNKKGFTLIEILICVLIIGVLAGVAIPQYIKVKIKAETREAILSVKALAEAQQRFYLLNSRYADTFSELDLDFSGYPSHSCPGSIGWYMEVFDCYSNEKFSLFIGKDYNFYALYNTGKYTLRGFIYDNNRMYCFVRGIENNLCNEILNCTLYYNSGSRYYYTCPNL